MAATGSLLLPVLLALLATQGTAAPATATELACSSSPKYCGGLDCPGYETLKDLGNDVELRRYTPSKWVVTDVDERGYEKATAVGFQRLVKYIWGDNELERKIEMTSPVVTTVRLDADQRIRDDFTVSFFLPREYQPEDEKCKAPQQGEARAQPLRRCTDPPAPRDDRVRIVNLGEVEAYVLPFGSYAVGFRIKRLALDFFDYLERNGESDFDRDNFLVAVYDPPYKLVNRHNELWVLKSSGTHSGPPQ